MDRQVFVYIVVYHKLGIAVYSSVVYNNVRGGGWPIVFGSSASSRISSRRSYRYDGASIVGPSLELISEHSVPFHAFPQAASVCTRQCAARQLSNGIETHLVAILVNTVAICNKSSENLAQNYE